MSRVQIGENLVSWTDEAFSQVRGSSKQMVAIIGEIAAASEEQSQGIDQINGAVAEMQTVTQRNAHSAEQLAEAMSVFKVNGLIISR